MEDGVIARTTPLSRDPTFSRHFADAGFAYFLGRDVDIAFVLNGPELREDTEPDPETGKTGIYADSKRTEVGRIRLPSGAATRLASDIFREMILANAGRRALAKRQIEQLTRLLEEAEQATPAEEV